MARIPSHSRSSPVNTSNGILSDPQVTQIVDTLPKSTKNPYPTRSLNSVTQVIIHHSSVSSKVMPNRLAKMQVAQGKAGIGYHVFIAGDGKLYQTNNFTTVSAHTAGHDQNSIAICFAGNFTRKAPNTVQIQAGKSVLQTLIEQFNIPLDNIKGANELSETQSPGKQWLTGRRWKNRLVRGLTAIPVTPTTPTIPAEEADIPNQPTSPPPDTDEQTNELSQAKADLKAAQNQIITLNRQITQLQSQVAQGQNLVAQITSLNARIAQLEQELAQAQNQASLNKVSADQTKSLNTRVTTLTTQLAEAKAAQTEAQTQINALNTQLRQVRSQLTQANKKSAQVTALQQKVTQLEGDLKTANDQVRQNTVLSEQVTTLNSQVTDLTAQLSQSQTAQQTAETSVNTLTNQLKELRNQLSGATQAGTQVAVLNQRIDQLEAELATAQSQANQSTTLSNQVTSLSTRLTELDTQLSQSKSAQEKSEQRVQSLNTQINQFRNQLTTATEEAAQVPILNEQIDQLEADLTTAQSSLTQSSTSAEQVTALNDRVAELTQQLAQAQTAHQGEETRANNLSEELKQIKAQLSKSGQQNTQMAILNQRIARLETELAAAKAQASQANSGAEQINTLNTHIAELTAQLAKAQSDQQSAVSKSTQLQAQLRQAQQASSEVTTLKQRVTELETALANSASSTSPQQTQQIAALNARITQLTQELSQAQQGSQDAQASKAEIASLNTRIAQLEAELVTAKQNANGQTTSGAPASAPAMQNVIDQLPQDDQTDYPTRNESDIDTIVIHHTAVPASVSAQRIAKVQVNQGKPGISYHYLIRGTGEILQTNLISTQTAHTAGHDAKSIAVAFAGNFTDVIPTDQQLQAGANLLAYLKGAFSVSQTNIKGASELANTQSPGRQWLDGKHWKNALLDKLNDISKSGIMAPASPAENDTTNQALKSQISVLQARIAELETNLSIAQEAALGQAGAVVSAPSTSAGTTVQQPLINDIVDDLPRHATKRYQSRSLSAIKRIIVHHTAVPASVSAERIANYNVSRNDWPGLGFHYMVTADGVVQQTNDLTTISYHTGGHNSDSIGVAFAGDFDETVPNEAQITAGSHLIAWLLDSLDLPLTELHAHKEYARTTCPGDQWNQGAVWRNTLLATVQDNLAGAGASGINSEEKSLHHYLLFWQTENDWARQDLISAGNYLSVFRPSLGFSVDDAMNAEYVTIVGGPLGISSEAEAKIRATGSKVERIAGNSEQATKALLDNLARQRKRFLFLDT
ncbi:MAG: N-acetylmuramoyl-L-alanine amidase [Chloroflexota bacterium]